MKYYLLCLAALLLCMALGAAVVFPLLLRKRGLGKKLLLSVLLGLALAAIGGGVFLSVYYHAAPEAAAALVSDEAVSVEAIDKGYLFDGPGTEAALVFYPGAKVESEAYAPLLRRLSEGGLDCFLVRMPLHMAVLDMDAAGELQRQYAYEIWLLAGHSMGGAVAANYVEEQPAAFQGLVLLAAYPTHPLPEGLCLLSIYGSEDGCLDRESYEAGRVFWPDSAAELVIDGGSHAGFGCYGPQRGDGEALIPAAEQQERTAAAILALIK